MAKKPCTRVNLCLTDETVAALDRIAAISPGYMGRASVVRKFLEDALPFLEDIAVALEEAEAQQTDALETFANITQEAAHQSNQLSLAMRKALKK